MKVKFDRKYGNHAIGDIGIFEKGEELDYILKTGTAILLESFDVNEDKEENEGEEFDTFETEINKKKSKSKVGK